MKILACWPVCMRTPLAAVSSLGLPARQGSDGMRRAVYTLREGHVILLQLRVGIFQ